MLQPFLRSSLFVVAAVCLAASLAHAQTVVAGQVLHRSKKAPLPNVSVELLGDRDTVLATAQSGADGTFTLVAPAAGTYRVRLTAPGAVAHVSDSLTVAEGEYAARAFPFEPEPRPLFEFEVDKPVMPARGSSTVRYPEDLRNRGVSGCALVQFVVDTMGRADTATYHVLKASHTEFAQAVRNALPRFRFTPAEVRGHKVRQLVQQPFDFSISTDSPALYRPRVEATGVVPPPPPSLTPPPGPPPLPKPAICGSSSR